MPDNNVQNIITLPPDNRTYGCPVLLDLNAVDAFLDWLQLNPEIERQLREHKTYRIGVLRKHIQTHHRWKDSTENKVRRIGLKKQLPHLQIEILSYNPSKDEKLIDEMQRAYFGGDPLDRKSAELLAYGRRHSSDNSPIRVISRHHGFRATPQTTLYVLNLDDIGIYSDAVFMRMFTSLDLHSKVINAAFKRMETGDYPVAIVETVKTFFAEVRQVVEPVDAALAKLDGHQLIHQAFDCAPEENKRDGTVKPEKPPKIKLNPLDKESEWSEQKGFRDLGCGTASAIRNPISHTAVDLDFIQDRFGDRRTALKFLCLLSLLFEKLDDRVAPR